MNTERTLRTKSAQENDDLYQLRHAVNKFDSAKDEIERFAHDAKGELVAIKGKNSESIAPIRGRTKNRTSRQRCSGSSFTLDNPFTAVAEHPGYKAFMDGSTNTGRIHIAATLPQLSKALVTGAPPAGIPAASYPRPVVGPITPRVRVFDLLRRQRVTVGQYEFVQLQIAPDSAKVQVEGAAKAEAAMTTVLKVAPIATVAVWGQVSKQAVADNPALQETLSSVFAGKELEKAHGLVVAGDGGATDVISGLVQQSTLIVTTATSVPDKFSEAIALMEDQGYGPAVVILNPSTWHNVRTSKSSGSGEYLAGNYGTPAPPSLWNLPVITTGALAADQALVVDTSYALLLDREQASVMISSEDRDNFIKNILTILAEVRLGLVVLDTGAVGLVEFS